MTWAELLDSWEQEQRAKVDGFVAEQVARLDPRTDPEARRRFAEELRERLVNATDLPLLRNAQ